MEIFPLKLNKCYNLLRKRAYLKKINYFNKITIMNRSDKITLDQIKKLDSYQYDIINFAVADVKVRLPTDTIFNGCW